MTKKALLIILCVIALILVNTSCKAKRTREIVKENELLWEEYNGTQNKIDSLGRTIIELQMEDSLLMQRILENDSSNMKHQ